MMEWGLLWFDDNPARDLTEKITIAAQRYWQKFGSQATHCFVHTSVLSGPQRIAGIRVSPLSTVLRQHFWLGRREE